MADGYLEKRLQDYEARKAAYLRKKKHLSQTSRQQDRQIWKESTQD